MKQMRVLLLLLASSLVFAQDNTVDSYRGLALITPYPSLTVRTGETTTLNVTVHNYGLPPQIINLELPQIAKDWKVSILGGGNPVKAVQLGPDESANLSLQLEPPVAAKPGDYAFVLQAKGTSNQTDLPLTLTLGEVLPPKLSLETDLPSIRGTASSTFSYSVSLKNESGQDSLVNLQAETPAGVNVVFHSSGKDVTSLPVKAGGLERLSVDINIPKDTPAGNYNITAHAVSDQVQADLPLTLQVTGQPMLSLSGPGGRLSEKAQIGRKTTFDLDLQNTGGAGASDVKLTATKPSGWDVTFDPEIIPTLAAGADQPIKVTLTPSKQAIAGDYVVTMRASAGGSSDSADFRITTTASTVWGIAGVGVIAVALAVMGLAVTRYGRR